MHLVQCSPVVKPRLIQKVNGQSWLRLNSPDFSVNSLGAEWQFERLREFQFWQMFTNAEIQWSHNSDLVPGPREAFRQRADHVRQSSRFGVRMKFAGDEKDFHAPQPNHGLTRINTVEASKD